jgi:hypothetical protein
MVAADQHISAQDMSVALGAELIDEIKQADTEHGDLEEQPPYNYYRYRTGNTRDPRNVTGGR